jgi:hypothetical protein
LPSNDVSKPESVNALFARIKQEFGGWMFSSTTRASTRPVFRSKS